jgi:hypothetical protein
MSRTEAQLAASRRNGAGSRGPVTDAGKAKSALNATKHGLWSTQVVLSTEDPAAFELFRLGLADEFGASHPAALELVNELAGARWRLDRIVNMETMLLNLEIERLQKDQATNPEADRIAPRYLSAVAFRNLHDRGILRHVHRQEARLRRMVDKLTDELMSVLAEQQPAPASDETNLNPSAPLRASVPREWRNEPGLAPKQTPKRPTYDKNGRRIHYLDQQAA